MIVYVYNKESNTKISTFKNVDKVESTAGRFVLWTGLIPMNVPKDNIKIVIYGF